LRSCKDTMTRSTGTADEYVESRDRSEGLMLSASGMIAFDEGQMSLSACHRRFCREQKLNPVTLAKLKLEMYDICLFFDPVSKRNMVTGFAVAPFKKTLRDHPGFPKAIAQYEPFSSFLGKCSLALDDPEMDARAESMHMRFSDDKYVDMNELQLSFEAFCSRNGIESYTLTETFLAKHNMIVIMVTNTKVVTGLEHIPVAE